MSIFKRAAMKKVRFQMKSGIINVEDLWDLSLPSLDIIARSLHKSLKESEEVSFITDLGVADAGTTLKFELVKEVIKTKLEAKKAKELRALKASQLSRLNEIMEKKQDASLEGQTVEELQAQIDELEK